MSWRRWLKSLFRGGSIAVPCPRRLDGRSEALLAASIKMLPYDEPGWIKNKEAKSLFSPMDDQYAFGEMASRQRGQCHGNHAGSNEPDDGGSRHRPLRTHPVEERRNGQNVLAAVPVPFINYHAGITPKYRGIHGGYWAKAEGDLENFGITVHLVDSVVDTGAVLYQSRIRPEPQDNYATFPYLQLAAGLPLL